MQCSWNVFNNIIYITNVFFKSIADIFAQRLDMFIMYKADVFIKAKLKLFKMTS